MIAKIKEVCKRHKEKLLYLIFGGLTTVVDWAISFALYYVWSVQIESNPVLVHGVDILAWVAAVTFAYVTNRIWVFKSDKNGFFPILGEIFSFAGGRVFTLLMQEAIMAVFVTWLGWNVYVFRVIAAILVIIANYIISKLLVFRKRKK